MTEGTGLTRVPCRGQYRGQQFAGTQETGVVNLHHADMAMYRVLSTSTSTSASILRGLQRTSKEPVASKVLYQEYSNALLQTHALRICHTFNDPPAGNLQNPFLCPHLKSRKYIICQQWASTQRDPRHQRTALSRTRLADPKDQAVHFSMTPLQLQLNPLTVRVH